MGRKGGFKVFSPQSDPYPVDELRARSELAKKYGIGSYDTNYLLLAMVMQAKLFTFDKALAAAAKEEGCYYDPAEARLYP